MTRKSKKFIYFGIFAAVVLGAVLFFTTRQDLKTTVCPAGVNNQQCWQSEIDATLNEKGLDAAFDLVARLYENEAEFGSFCHGNTDELGEKAYGLFVKHRDFKLTPKTAYCGYGFYHGFMEALIADSHDFAEARAFCDYAEKQLAAYTKNAIGACYHGIGHGAMDGGDPRDWGNEDALTESALALCDQVSVIPDNYHRCASGVYNALVLAYGQKQYNLTMPKDPFTPCRKNMRDEYKIACYEQMNSSVMIVSGHDFRKAAEYPSKVLEDIFATKAIYSLAESAAAASNISNRGPDDVIEICQSLQTRLMQPCLSGFATGLIEHGPPGKEHEASLKFCQNMLMHPNFQRGCLQQSLVFLRVLFPEEQVMQFCRENLTISYKEEFCHD